MARRKSATNPFYALLVVVGVVFVVNVFAYGLMTYEATRPVTVASERHADHPLWRLLDRYGDQMLWVELALLGVLSVGAIATDRYFSIPKSRTLKPEKNGDGGKGKGGEFQSLDG